MGSVGAALRQDQASLPAAARASVSLTGSAAVLWSGTGGGLASGGCRDAVVPFHRSRFGWCPLGATSRGCCCCAAAPEGLRECGLKWWPWPTWWSRVGPGGPPDHAHVSGSFWDARALVAARVLHLRMELVEMLVHLVQAVVHLRSPHLERAHAPPQQRVLFPEGGAASRAPSQETPCPPPRPPRWFLDQDAASSRSWS